MKIKLTLDAAYAFDYLSILEVKKDESESIIFLKMWESKCDEICKQLGVPLFNKIINSKEYDELYEINKEIFEKIDELKINKEITAKDIDDLNYKRFLCKKELQNKFFNEDLIEQKIGY